MKVSEKLREYLEAANVAYDAFLEMDRQRDAMRHGRENSYPQADATYQAAEVAKNEAWARYSPPKPANRDPVLLLQTRRGNRTAHVCEHGFSKEQRRRRRVCSCKRP